MQTRRRQQNSEKAIPLTESKNDVPSEANSIGGGGTLHDVKDIEMTTTTSTTTTVELGQSKNATNEVLRAVVIPSKRKKSPTTSSNKVKKPDIPHSAKLPPIVWVFDEKYQWWPGKISPYPPVNHKATVSRFGNIKPKTIKIECSESTIQPFGDKHHDSQFSKDRTSHLEAFGVALKLAAEAQIEDDDDLPGWDDVMNELSTAPKPAASFTPSTVQKEKQRVFAKTESNYFPDMSLAIPGELVLAWSDRLYYPGRIASFNNKTNKYKIDYATGHSQSIERKKFYTRYEKGFLTCTLGTLALPSADFHYEDKELEAQVHALYPDLYDIIAGKQDKAGRLEAFLEGGKTRKALTQRVGAGSFGRGEYGLIGSLLQSEFLPDLITTKNPNSKNGDKRPMKEEGDVTIDFSDTRRLLFVQDVLLPETITRLTMVRNNISYEEADKQISECKRDEKEDTWWVDDILAARESFLDGKD